jgi:hypothetical protein
MRKRGCSLFSKVDWFSVDQQQRKKLVEEVAKIDGNRLLNTSLDDLCDYFEEKYKIDVPILRRDEIIADQHETQLDVSRDPRLYIRDRSRPCLIDGTAIEISVPFSGEAELFYIKPSSFTLNPPMGEVQEGLIVLRIEGTDLQADQVRREIDSTLAEIEKYLTTLRTNVQGLNGQLRSLARDALERRRQKLLSDRNLVSSLGFNIKERRDAPRTYVTREVRRKIAPSLPPASTAPYKPDPELSTSDYDHILNVIQNMAHVMEWSPSAFASMDEESLRSHFLVQLNGHYEGQATGETFNYEGKTDILIRSEGKNIFIAECKYWAGAKKLTSTLDQLLGYSCWRDTKVAVIIFNRNKDFSKVLQSIRDTVKDHPNCKHDLGPQSETNFRYLFAHRDDPNREMLLTVLAFEVPS